MNNIAIESLSIETLRDNLREIQQHNQQNPESNSVFTVARSLFFALETGEIEISDIAGLVDELYGSLVENRAKELRTLHFTENEDRDWTVIRDILNALADKGWDEFQRTLETVRGGIVFTAHPTFALPKSVRSTMASYAEDPSSDASNAIQQEVRRDHSAWPSTISLDLEHDEVQDALENAQSALNQFAHTIFEVAKAKFPDQWMTLLPVLPTLASWVGYDLDGRTDINWWQSVSLRLAEKAIQLDRYAARLKTIGVLPELQQELLEAASKSREDADLFAGDEDLGESLSKIGAHFSGPEADRTVSIKPILEQLTDAISTQTPDVAKELCVLRAEMETLGLGSAHIHLRINAAQVRTVISRDLGLDTEDQNLGRVALQTLTEMAKAGDVREPNFSDLYFEQSTARRQMIMTALWLKYVDADAPVRLLIAESENPATVMGALYLARQYGVDGMIDISPLFETPEALESGGRFIDRLLEEEEFLQYVSARGRLCIQLGFSDAGRFIGQVAASMAIERIQNLVAQALHEKAPGIDLLIFNTHGESMGRGAYPGTFKQRFEHVLTRWVRESAIARNQNLIHEISFQGGDGYLHFATPQLAQTTLIAWCEHSLTPPESSVKDPFYEDRDFTWDKYRYLRAWHENFIYEPEHTTLLGDFAVNMLIKAGSRQTKRPGDAPLGPRNLRAISHNATLQQLGIPANTTGGFGSSARREQDRFIALLDESSRMQSLLNLALRARIVTSVPALRAYAKVYDPSFWVAMSKHVSDSQANAYRRVYAGLRARKTFADFSRVCDHLSIDMSEFDHLLGTLKDAPSAEERHEARLDLHVLHALRISLMMHSMAIAARVPAFSGRHEINTRDILSFAFRMQLGDASNAVDSIFPKSHIHQSFDSAQGVTGDGKGYDDLQAEIVKPLAEIQKLIHHSGLAISQVYKAYG